MKKIISILLFIWLCSIWQCFGANNALTVLKNPQNGKNVRYAGIFSSEKVLIPQSYVIKRKELRGILVSTGWNIDFGVNRTEKEFKKEYLTLIENIKRRNFNVVFFQIRPQNDAFYKSKLNPWSSFMAGSEGQGIGNFDPLPFMIDEAHKRGIEFHAWLNPYRVAGATKLTKTQYLNTLSAKNFARRNPQLVMDVPIKGGKRLLILNPGEPQVIRFLNNTVKEIIENYKVDAIFMDDYFYPYEGSSNADLETYKKYNPKKLSLENWRRNNVNTLVSIVKQTINNYNRNRKQNVQFGISPFGIWANRSSLKEGSLTRGAESYFMQHADSRFWVKNNMIDYIVPQIYWSFNHDVAAYAAVCDFWTDLIRGSRVKLYIAHSVHNLGTNSKWHEDELINQLRYDCKYPAIRGEVLFSYRSVFKPSNRTMARGVEKLFRLYWKNPVPIR